MSAAPMSPALQAAIRRARLAWAGDPSIPVNTPWTSLLTDDEADEYVTILSSWAGEEQEPTAVALPVRGVIGGAREPEHVNDRGPNFTQAGRFFLVRCYACDSADGRANHLTAVSSGRCAWCGWPDFPTPTGKAA